ncbi:hypothetical protein I550_1078 [Mycobacterium intracellulare 1956]|uniref:Uncharacterized protein n=1 Tax=Mycobacterium intracellulare 1956 TaxID=1299331 RepID=X8CQ14_MYCIT|nr:hypothetical protein I550_1078 [Mycobacterium intracellulare 1956]
MHVRTARGGARTADGQASRRTAAAIRSSLAVSATRTCCAPRGP